MKRGAIMAETEMYVIADENVTKEEKDNIVELFKHLLANPRYRAFSDYEQERFFKVVNVIHVTGGDDAYLEGTTFFVGCDISRAKIDPALKNVMYFHYDKRFPEEAKKESSSGSCYIATACYGSYDCPQVLTFRNFRDTYLAQTILGKVFIKIYYALSPKIADWLKNKCRINAFIRINILDRIYELLRGKF
jgi:hypothetical protein